MVETHFVNPFAEGADPQVVHDGARYLWCQSEGNVGIAIWTSDRPTTLGTKHVVWWAPEHGPCSREVWAPELIALDGRWYIYFAASDGDNKHHLTYVLESATDDPLGEYTLHGPLRTGNSHEDDAEPIWAIDMTVLELAGSRYALWSGWPAPHKDQQDLYIAPLETPVRLGGERRLLSRAGDYDWERVDETSHSRGLAEAPQVLQREGHTFVAYSCAASWLPTYKVGLLELIGTDPLDQSHWRKREMPLFQSNDATFGVGHPTFTTSPDGRDWWHIYHAKRDRDPGGRRALFAQPMRWRSDGSPDLGSQPVPAGAPVPLPSGTPNLRVHESRTWQFASTGSEGFDIFGHHQYIAAEADGLHLGIVPAEPVNAYRSGEKAVVRDGDYRDFRAVLDFTIREGGHDAGLVFRVSRPSVGFDAQRGYFAGLSAGRQSVVIGAMNGIAWRELGSAPVYLEPGGMQRLTVTAAGETLTVYVGSDPLPALTVHDDAFERGSVGMRVVDTHAVFATLTVTPG